MSQWMFLTGPNVLGGQSMYTRIKKLRKLLVMLITMILLVTITILLLLKWEVVEMQRKRLA